MKTRRILAIVLALVLALSLALPALATRDDNQTLTRGAFVTALFARSGAADTPAQQTAFTDVPAEGPLAQAVRWASEHGIVQGFGDGRFGPEEPVTREQMAAMMYRFASLQGQGFQGAWMFPLDFPDADQVSDWADEAMHWVVMHKIIVGTGAGLEPQALSTEGQLSLVIDRWQRSVDGMDYLVLVNKLNRLPEDWESRLHLDKTVNSVGDTVEVEHAAYMAYLELKSELAEEDDIAVELDSARRSVAEQQDIMDRFTAKYGADYAAKTVAQPGYSEHHTGLALDLYLRVDGRDVYYNEDMMKPEYAETWAKIHARLADHGFILRYLEGKEHITGYGYEPWHIRYVGIDAARQIMAAPGMTLEVWLGESTDPELGVKFGNSARFTQEELAEAMVQVKCRFAAFAGCELHNIRYAGDRSGSAKNVRWLNSLEEGTNYADAVCILTDFHSPKEAGDYAWERDLEYCDYQWWLAREAGGGWQLVTRGYVALVEEEGMPLPTAPAENAGTVTPGVLKGIWEVLAWSLIDGSYYTALSDNLFIFSESEMQYTVSGVTATDNTYEREGDVLHFVNKATNGTADWQMLTQEDGSVIFMDAANGLLYYCRKLSDSTEPSAVPEEPEDDSDLPEEIRFLKGRWNMLAWSLIDGSFYTPLEENVLVFTASEMRYLVSGAVVTDNTYEVVGDRIYFVNKATGLTADWRIVTQENGPVIFIDSGNYLLYFCEKVQ